MPKQMNELIQDANEAAGDIKTALASAGESQKTITTGLDKRESLETIAKATHALTQTAATFESLAKTGQKALGGVKGVKNSDAVKAYDALQGGLDDLKSSGAKIKTFIAASTKRFSEAQQAQTEFLKLVTTALEHGAAWQKQTSADVTGLPGQVELLEENFKKLTAADALVNVLTSGARFVEDDLNACGANITSAESVASSLEGLGAKADVMHAGMAQERAQDAARVGKALSDSVKKLRAVHDDAWKRYRAVVKRREELRTQIKAARIALPKAEESTLDIAAQMLKILGASVRKFLDAYENVGLRDNIDVDKVKTEYKSVEVVRQKISSSLAQDALKKLEATPAYKLTKSLGLTADIAFDDRVKSLDATQLLVSSWVRQAETVYDRIVQAKVAT